MTAFRGSALTLALAGLLTSACGGEAPPKTRDVALNFRAMVGSQPFACGQTYTGLGTTRTTFEPRDFRLYVHDVRLLTPSGEEVPVTVTDDGMWQRDGVVLLDFENKTGLCSNGTEAMNTRIVGTMPDVEVTGLRFKVGIPFELNHQDPLVTGAPLNVSTLFWGWEAGRVFVRVDGRTTGLSGFNFHLGSTGCQTSAPNQVTSCAFPNRFEVELRDFQANWSTDVVMDMAALFSGSNLDTNQAQSAPGCMSAQNDTDCNPIFERLGLGIGGASDKPGTQVFFRKG